VLPSLGAEHPRLDVFHAPEPNRTDAGTEPRA
jgi:hypothetical protein